MRVAVFLAAVLAAPAVASAGAVQPPAGDWSLVAALRPGTAVVVVTSSGESVHGAFVGLDAADLVVADPAGEHPIPRPLVRRVSTPGTPGRVGRGALKGGLIGAGLGLALLAGLYANCGDGCEAPSIGGPLAGALMWGGGGGAAIGALLGRGAGGAPRDVFRASVTP